MINERKQSKISINFLKVLCTILSPFRYFKIPKHLKMFGDNKRKYDPISSYQVTCHLTLWMIKAVNATRTDKAFCSFIDFLKDLAYFSSTFHQGINWRV
jgi:hypothetical protein